MYRDGKIGNNLSEVCEIIKPLLNQSVFVEALVIDESLESLIECFVNTTGDNFPLTLFLICLRIGSVSLWDHIFSEPDTLASMLEVLPQVCEDYSLPDMILSLGMNQLRFVLNWDLITKNRS